MALQPLYLAPGIDKSDSAYSDQQAFAFVTGNAEASRIGRGRYVDASWARFLAGFPEKIGGYQQVAMTGITSFTDVPRKTIQFSDYLSDSDTFTITDTHLYRTTSSLVTSDITPPQYINTGTLTNQLATTNTSTSVKLTLTAAWVAVGDMIFVSAASAVGGLTIDGYYPVTVNSGTVITFLFPTAATATASSGGGSISYSLPTYYLASNPFTTSSGSHTVTVTDSSHNVNVGDYADFSGATAVNGVTISGEYKVQTATSGSYTITAATAATGNGSGGGSVVIVTYPISQHGKTLYEPGGVGVSIAQYGLYLLSSWQQDTIYVWGWSASGTTVNRSYPLLNAPSSVQVMFVTPEQYVVALTTPPVSATTPVQTLVSWCDQNNFTTWTPASNNTAESNRPVIGGNYWTAAVAVRDGTSLISTDKCVFQMAYNATDGFTYDISLAGDNCGALGQMAMASRGGVAFWASNGDIWSWNGSVGNIPTDDIRDYLYRNMNSAEWGKVVVGTHSLKKEVWILFPSTSATENDSYIIFHQDQGVFSVGQLTTFARSGWMDNVPNFTPLGPLSLDTSGNMWQMDIGHDAISNSGTTAIDSWVTTSFIELSNGDTNLDLGGFILDTARQVGSLELTFLTQYYPEDTATSTGPVTIGTGTSRIDERLDGRICAFKLESNTTGGDYRLGLCRLEVKPSGARR